MKKVFLIILFLVAARAVMNLLLPAPYLFYDEQIYYWIAKHFSEFGTFHCGFDKFPAVRILYQLFISTLCHFDFPIAFRLIQIFNWLLLGSGLFALAIIFKNKLSDKRFVIPLIAAAFMPSYWGAGQIMPENLMFAVGAWSIFFFFNFIDKRTVNFTKNIDCNRQKMLIEQFFPLFASVILFLLAFFAKPHIAIALPALFITFFSCRKVEPRFNRQKMLIAVAIFCGLVLLMSTFVFSNNFLSKTFFHSSAFPKITLLKFLSIWSINFLRYLSLPILICGVVPPISLLIVFSSKKFPVAKKEKSIIIFSVSYWIIAALVISWFASWRNISYWQHDIFERYFGLALPFIAGTGMFCVFRVAKISKKTACYFIFIVLFIAGVLTPLIINRADENGPGTLLFYLLGCRFGALFTFVTLSVVLITGIITMLKRSYIKILYTFIVLFVLFVVSGFRLADYSKKMYLSGLPYFSMIEKCCKTKDPFILLSVGTPNSWLYSRLRTKQSWLEYDITGISNKEIEMQLRGNAMIAGDKYVAAPVWYKLPFSPLAITNGFAFFKIRSNIHKDNFIDEIICVDRSALTNIYKFFLPYETTLVANVVIEFRTDNVVQGQIGTVTISDKYNLRNSKMKKLEGQTGINIVKLKVYRPNSTEPFCINICLSTNWPILRAYTNFPLSQTFKDSIN